MRVLLRNAFIVLIMCIVSLASGQGFREIEYASEGSANAFGLSTGPTDAAPTFIDIDGDQDLDLFVGQESGLISFFENVGTSTEPDYIAPVLSPFGISDNLDRSSPTFVDIDDDGDYDLLVGTSGNLAIKFTFYLNIGTRVSPIFERSDS